VIEVTRAHVSNLFRRVKRQDRMCSLQGLNPVLPKPRGKPEDKHIDPDPARLGCRTPMELRDTHPDETGELVIMGSHAHVPNPTILVGRI